MRAAGSKVAGEEGKRGQGGRCGREVAGNGEVPRMWRVSVCRRSGTGRAIV